MGQIVVASRHGNFPVRKGDKIAGMRVVPLVIEEEKMEQVRQACGAGPIFQILPFRNMKAVIVTTGSEVYYGRIQDKFTPVVIEKLEEYGIEVLGNTVCNDDSEMVTEAVREWLGQEADMVVCTGGMSVDPDDRTPGAIKATGTRIVSYGAPVLPGAMMLVSYYEKDGRQIPILGLPGCVMYAKRTIFDIILPAVMSNYPVTGEYLAGLGEGGLCLSCQVCTYPNCGFGKGHGR